MSFFPAWFAQGVKDLGQKLRHFQCSTTLSERLSGAHRMKIRQKCFLIRKTKNRSC